MRYYKPEGKFSDNCTMIDGDFVFPMSDEIEYSTVITMLNLLFKEDENQEKILLDWGTKFGVLTERIQNLWPELPIIIIDKDKYYLEKTKERTKPINEIELDLRNYEKLEHVSSILKGSFINLVSNVTGELDIETMKNFFKFMPSDTLIVNFMVYEDNVENDLIDKNKLVSIQGRDFYWRRPHKPEGDYRILSSFYEEEVYDALNEGNWEISYQHLYHDFKTERMLICHR